MPKACAVFLSNIFWLFFIFYTPRRILIMDKYECVLCGYVYDPEVGDAELGIEPGIAFEELPDDLVCPLCKHGAADFEPIN